MKTSFVLISLMVVLFLAVPNRVEAQKRKTAKIIEGTISGYECGDNCYLTITDQKGKEHTGLCTASVCTKWNENAMMPDGYKGKRVKVTIGKGTLLTGAGDVAGTMDAFTKIQFTESETIQGTMKKSQKKEILWDFRKDEIKTQNYSKAETNIVLKYLLGNQRNVDLEITRRVSGSFTKANANETLYYIAGCEEDEGFTTIENCAHANWFNAGLIAIYDGTTPKMKIKAALGSDLARITDINNDGIDEILSLSVWAGQGVALVGAILGQIVNGEYKEIKIFSKAYGDSCAVQEKSRRFAKATVISYVQNPNGAPIFSQEYFQNRCGNTAWKKITKKQFESEWW